MKQSLLTLLFIASLSAIVACSTPKKQVHKSTITDIEIIKPRDSNKEICHELESYLVKRYYDFSKKQHVMVKLDSFGCNIPTEPFLGEYMRECISNDLKNAPQFGLVSGGENTWDCSIDLHIIKENESTISILFLVRDQELNAVIHARSLSYRTETVMSNDYRRFVTRHANELKARQEEKQKSRALLIVQAVSSGQSFEIMDFGDRTYYRVVNDEEDGYYTESSYTGIGGTETFTSYYPANINFYFNGKAYSIDPNTDILFKDYVEPGKHNCSVSFAQAHYDGRDNKQILGKIYTKNFTLNLPENEIVRIYVKCIYDGEQSHIFLKAQ